jgi:predicted ribonuclease toxin of YeeF-YezG toxin-antitoxin module
MPANSEPIFTRVGDVSSNGTTGMATALVTATGDYTGVSANHQLVFTADSTNGGYVQRLRFQATGTNTASVARIYLNNGSSNTTATNNTFYGQVSLPATTAINTAATVEIDYPMNVALNPGFRIYAGLGTTVAASWVCTAVGGKY